MLELGSVTSLSPPCHCGHCCSMAGLGCGIPEGSMGWEMCIVLLQASHIPVAVPGWKEIRMEEMWTQRVQSTKGLEGIF